MKLKYFFLAVILSILPASAYAACTGQFTTGQICANPTGSTNVPTGSTVSKLFDFLYGTNSGTIIYRSGSGWTSIPGNNTGTQILSENSSGVPAWITVSGTGTVTSVALAAPPIFTVSGSPVTSGGTLTFASANESANTFWAGPTSGGATTPAFRGIVIGDFPSIATNTVLGNSTSGSAVPTAMSIPSCSGANNALIWTTNTGFGCNSLTSTGTVTSVATGTGLTGGPVTTTGTISLAAIAADNVLGNATGGSAAPGAVPLTNCNAAQNALTYNTGTHSFGCNVISGSGTVVSGTAGQLAYYGASTNVVNGNSFANISSGVLTLGIATTNIGQLVLEGSASGAVTITPQAAAGTPTVTFGTASGTPAVTASAPLAITSATGNIAITGVAGQVLAGAGPAFTATPTLGAIGVATGQVKMAGTTSGTVTFSVADAAGTWTMKLPTSAGSNGQFLETDGAGNASWATVLGSGTVDSGTAGQLAYYSASTNEVGGNTNATIVAGALTLGQSGTAGSVALNGGGSQKATIVAQATAGNSTLTLPNTTGTFAVGASAPLALSATTGNLTITGAAGQVLAGAGPAFTATPTLGASGTIGTIAFGNATSGTVTLGTVTGALGSAVLSLPAVTDTLAGKALANGGTNNSLTASNGGIVWSDASKLNILAGTATASQILQSGASATPAWSTATYPATTTANQILYSSATNVVSGLATANNSVLVTNGSGVPVLSGVLPTNLFINGQLIVGITGSVNGDIAFENSTSGFVAIQPPSGALGSSVLTLPAATGTLLSTAGAVAQGNAGNPAPTTSTSGVMAGLGASCSITPLYSTRVFFEIAGQVFNTSGGTNGALIALRYGTGGAPANGAAVTGNALGNINGGILTSTSQFMATTVIGVGTGLSPGTAYWFDIIQIAFGGGTAGIFNPTCLAYEM